MDPVSVGENIYRVVDGRREGGREGESTESRKMGMEGGTNIEGVRVQWINGSGGSVERKALPSVGVPDLRDC